MSFDSCITSLGEELYLKYPAVKHEEIKQVNEEDRRLELIEKIQLNVRKIMENIAKGQFPVFNSLPRHTWANCSFDRKVQPRETKGKTKRIDFKRRNSRADFSAIVFLLSKIHKLLMTKQMSTRRELYYENLKIFKSQRQVDKGMKEICHLLDAPAWELRVVATSKGIVAGPVVLTMANGESLDCDTRGGVSIPQNVLQITKMSTSATWVLIVEKDACFQRLVTADAANKLDSCILITGKGFPDVNSRILVCKFWELLRIPIFVLVDADPHGFEIMCVYRFGSLSMSSCSGHLACPAVRWLGIHPSDIRPLLLDAKNLTLGDRKKISLLLKRPYVEEDENLRAELQILLEGNVKAEIEGTSCISANYLTNIYMKNKIQSKEYL